MHAHCRKIISGDHPDIYIIGRDKTASINHVRELIRRSSLKPNDSEKQVFIVCNAGNLRADAQNALLKLFEEPPETVALFLLTESRASLLPTVLSRGQRIHLDGMRDSELEEKLRDKYPSVKSGDIYKAVKKSRGNLAEAEKYLSKESAALREKAGNLLLLALGKKSYDLSRALIQPKFKREQLHALLCEFVSAVNEAEKHKYRVADAELPCGELGEKLNSASKRALARMGEAATVCMINLENNANVTAAATKLTIDLLRAAAF